MRKILTSVVALVLTVATLFTFASCHKQNAVVATYKEDTVTSGLYLLFLVNADNNARALVDEQNAENEDFDAQTANYYKMDVTIEAENEDEEDTKVNFKQYVKQKAEESLKQYFYVKQLADEKKITLTKEEEEEAKSLANYYWAYYGYAGIYEPNAISYESYETYIVRQQLNFKIFKELYKVGGEKGVTEKKLKTEFEKNYLIANTVAVGLTKTDDQGNAVDMTDKEKKQEKQKLENYAEKINKGEVKFKDVYELYNGKVEQGSTVEDDQPKPKDMYATVYGAEGTSATNENYETIKKLYSKKGAGYAQVIENKDAKQYILVVTADITKDDYYYDTYLDDLTNLLYNDEYTEQTKQDSEKIEVEYNKYELNYLKPEKISYEMVG